ncbi:enolase C-terminal domain-like protein [Gordonia soli]|uniref:Mandelate racemase/muconate lactonizing enzyme family protein n=1 Tax=Gordonia soli NBRC 108243 TaxID=1223545 RepID=M0QJQ6_9ACTN|nr:enolase C-terminal domain-like protein [Gordonia soli]GAC67672.1 mandelate racemase/muconate lactonizing enzyme family protein [Gordonia soli NBRC 108243]
MSLIDRIEVSTFDLPVENFAHNYDDDTYGGSFTYAPGVTSPRQVLMVQVFTEDGLEGNYAFWSVSAAVPQAVSAARVAVGHRWHEREAIFRAVRRAARPAHSYGLSFLDVALWDLAAKAQNVSLTQLLGGDRTEVSAYASCHNGDVLGNLSDQDAVADFFLSLQEKGFRGFKMHSWHKGDKWQEAANVANMREKLGERVELMLDPACVFDSLSDAIFVGKACEESGFRWYEDPIRPTGLGAFQHRKLREALNIPILQTEHVAGPEAKADFLLAGGTDLLRVDVHYDLGITGALKTIHFGESLGVTTEMHAPSPVHRHLIAAMQQTTLYEVANVSPAGLDPSPEIYTNYSDHVDSISATGTLAVPTGPGVGVEYDFEKLLPLRSFHEIVKAG